MNVSPEVHRMPDAPAAEPGELLLCVPAGWEAYISLEFHELQHTLVAQGWSLLEIGKVDDAAILVAIRRARIVLLWEAYEFLERQADALTASGAADTLRARKIVFCDDVHYFTDHRRRQRLRAFIWADLILATYPDKLLKWFPEIFPYKVQWTPHAAASYFQPAQAPSSDRILLSGARLWPYPFRQFCSEKLPDSVCEVVDHPGYPGYPGNRVHAICADPEAMRRFGQQRYALLLNRHPAMLVCGSVFGYLVAKVFEGMAAGCLVIADRASLGERMTALGLIEGEHYVGTDLLHVMEDAVAVRDAFLRGDPWCARMVNNAARTIAARHTTAHRAAQIHRFCLRTRIGAAGALFSAP